MQKYILPGLLIMLTSCTASTEFTPGDYLATFSSGSGRYTSPLYTLSIEAGELMFQFEDETFSVINSNDEELLEGNWEFKDGKSALLLVYAFNREFFEEKYSIEYRPEGGLHSDHYYVLENPDTALRLNLYPYR